ncbi:hypothetical protein C0995_012512 [Termitomyces sp. Mi166|nr:hypothetical protein C0995_012512 [Termitomyces sp. Mi166\
MLLGRLSTPKRRFIVVPLIALVFSFIIYSQEYLLYGPRSTKSAVSIVVSSSAFGSAYSQPVCVPPTPEKPAFLLPHTYRDDGILEVNPDGGHPIFELIELANARWKSKLERASKTFDEAVREYVKRYKRRPPKGFDKWWRYVEENNVQLPDEYNQIYKDLEPFWGYHPRDLQELRKEQEFHTDTFTLGLNGTDQLDILRVSFASSTNNWNPDDLLGGARSIIEILRDVEQDLPPFRAVVSPHDSPTLFSDYEVKKMALDAASSNTHCGKISKRHSPSDMDMESIAIGPPHGWLSGCSPTSPAHQKSSEERSEQKTFIYDHRKAMDPCLHPHLLENIGEFLVHEHPSPSHKMLPRFAYCATLMHHDIQIPTLSGWVDDVLPRSDDPEWDQKLDERLVWRGSNTGMWHAPDTRWQKSQRTRLIDFANELNGTVKVLLSSSTEDVRIGEGIEIPRGKINPSMMDIAFAGEPVGCHEETCSELRQRFEWRRRQGLKETGQFRFFDRIEPWVHYVPVQVDYSDVYDALVFFRGGLYGEGGHEELARTIASEGRRWSQTFWRKEDVTAYVYR